MDRTSTSVNNPVIQSLMDRRDDLINESKVVSEIIEEFQESCKHVNSVHEKVKTYYEQRTSYKCQCFDCGKNWDTFLRPLFGELKDK